MSQIACQRRRLPVPVALAPRRRRSPLDPIQGNPMRPAPSRTLNPALDASSTLSHAEACSHPGRVAQCRASIECAANLKSP